jgi:transcription elongation GreA/GreB family factor
MTRDVVIQALCAALASELAAIESVAADARSEATGAESKQEGKYDTRATEASYLARGQAFRVVELRQLVAWFDHMDLEVAPLAVGVGALVQLGGDKDEWVFLAPVGGASATVDGTTVRVISPSSPLGAALLGLEEDDTVEVETPRGPIEVDVVTVI